MKNIQDKERLLLDKFRTMKVENCNVKILFANEDQLIDNNNEFRIQLPSVSFETLKIGTNKLVMKGIIHCLYRKDLNAIIEQMDELPTEEDDLIFNISEVSLEKDISCKQPTIMVKKATFEVNIEQKYNINLI